MVIVGNTGFVKQINLNSSHAIEFFYISIKVEIKYHSLLGIDCMQSWSHYIFRRDGHTDKCTCILVHKKVLNMFPSLRIISGFSSE